ncbi:MAG: phosphatidylglycerophosphatase A [Sulfuricurvum sp. RIFCSPHIGHO2_02_FULL_43_9]|nr:MAG: phosphatidylglycerophosphatase A [Sulfuricurvum sp. RIFCSPHIGHO2_02_FULL_43_9]
MNWFFLTVGYSGLSPKAPGTMGTLASLPLGVAILLYLGPQTLFLAALLITLIAIKSINTYEAQSGNHDDQRIVIDELVGLWFALSIAPGIGFDIATLMQWNNGIALQIIMSFIFFRLYDIKKPSIIGRIDREAKGGLGVMGDDIIAGFAAGITAAIIWQAILKSGLVG